MFDSLQKLSFLIFIGSRGENVLIVFPINKHLQHRTLFKKFMFVLILFNSQNTWFKKRVLPTFLYKELAIQDSDLALQLRLLNTYIFIFIFILIHLQNDYMFALCYLLCLKSKFLWKLLHTKTFLHFLPNKEDKTTKEQ